MAQNTDERIVLATSGTVPGMRRAPPLLSALHSIAALEPANR
jgi:hypothetical protein